MLDLKKKQYFFNWRFFINDKTKNLLLAKLYKILTRETDQCSAGAKCNILLNFFLFLSEILTVFKNLIGIIPFYFRCVA